MDLEVEHVPKFVKYRKHESICVKTKPCFENLKEYKFRFSNSNHPLSLFSFSFSFFPFFSFSLLPSSSFPYLVPTKLVLPAQAALTHLGLAQLPASPEPPKHTSRAPHPMPRMLARQAPHALTPSHCLAAPRALLDLNRPQLA